MQEVAHERILSAGIQRILISGKIERAGGNHGVESAASIRGKLPSPHYAIVFITRFSGKIEPELSQNTVRNVLLRQGEGKDSDARYGGLRDFNQMTRHFGSKTTTLKFWKSEIRYLDFAIPRGRTKCSRADYRVLFKNQTSHPRRI